MKRLALVLATAAVAVLGTACGTNCPTGTTLVSWNGFDGPGAGVVNVPCGPAGVATVDIWLDGNIYVGNWLCTDYGAAVPGVPTGGSLLTVEGLAGGPGSTILFRDELTYTQNGCGNVALQAFPGAGRVELDYSFSPTNACASPGPTFMWVAVDDDIASAPAFTDTGLTSAQLCSVTAPAPQYSLPSGSFTLVGIQEVTAGSLVVGADCTHRPFTVGTGAVTTVSPVLVDSVVACF